MIINPTLKNFPFPIDLRQKRFGFWDPGALGRANDRKKSALAVTAHYLLF
jgi:hypothetical protein